MKHSTARLILWTTGLLCLAVITMAALWAGSITPAPLNSSAELYDQSAYWAWWALLAIALAAGLDFARTLFNRREKDGDD